MIGIVVAVIVTAVVLVPICNSLTEGDGGSGGDSGGGEPTTGSWEDYPFYNVERREYTEVGQTLHITLEDLQGMANSAPVMQTEDGYIFTDDFLYDRGLEFDFNNEEVHNYFEIYWVMFDNSAYTKTVIIDGEINGEAVSGYIGGDPDGVNALTAFDFTISPSLEISGTVTIAGEGGVNSEYALEGTLNYYFIYSLFSKHFPEFWTDNYSEREIDGTKIDPSISVELPSQLVITADDLREYIEFVGEGLSTLFWIYTSPPTNGTEITRYEVWRVQSTVGSGDVPMLTAQTQGGDEINEYGGYLEEPVGDSVCFVTDFQLSIDKDCNSVLRLETTLLGDTVTISAPLSMYLPSFVDVKDISVGGSESVSNDSGSSGGGSSDSDGGNDLGVAGTIIGIIPVFVILAILMGAAGLFYQNRNGL